MSHCALRRSPPERVIKTILHFFCGETSAVGLDFVQEYSRASGCGARQFTCQCYHAFAQASSAFRKIFWHGEKALRFARLGLWARKAAPFSRPQGFVAPLPSPVKTRALKASASLAGRSDCSRVSTPHLFRSNQAQGRRLEKPRRFLIRRALSRLCQLSPKRALSKQAQV